MHYRTLQTITELDDSKFKPLRGDTQSRFQQLYNNLWSMFDLEEARKHPDFLIQQIETNDDKPSVSNFSWTDEVQHKFYAHPLHRRFVCQWRNAPGMTWGMFCLDAEPRSVEKGV